MKRKTLLAVLLALLAAPAFAHFQDWVLPAFLSRCSSTREATITDFTTFKLQSTILFIR